MPIRNRSEVKQLALASTPNETLVLALLASGFLLLHLLAVSSLMTASTREPITRSLESLALYD